ncbi:hypothetical protein BH20ACI1_BH20ACI1_21090 [soil metagenome]
MVLALRRKQDGLSQLKLLAEGKLNCLLPLLLPTELPGAAHRRLHFGLLLFLHILKMLNKTRCRTF